jgi:hypothetical protein
MLIDPAPPDRRAPSRPRSAAVSAFLVLALLLVLFLRHDYWNWTTPRPLLLGVIPVGLWWQAVVSLLASGVMWLLVRFAWPEELEELADEPERGEP